MNSLEALTYLFFDCFFASLIIPIRQETVIHTMLIFAEYDRYIIFIIASLAGVLGSLLNYYIGFFVFRLRDRGLFHIDDKLAERSQSYANKYFSCLILLSALNFWGSLITFFAGFARINFLLYISLLISSRLFYYLYTIISAT